MLLNKNRATNFSKIPKITHAQTSFSIKLVRNLTFLEVSWGLEATVAIPGALKVTHFYISFRKRTF